MIDGCDEYWFEDYSKELQLLNFVQFILPHFVKSHFNETVIMNNKLLNRLITGECEQLAEHNLLMWISSFVLIYSNNKSITVIILY